MYTNQNPFLKKVYAARKNQQIEYFKEDLESYVKWLNIGKKMRKLGMDVSGPMNMIKTIRGRYPNVKDWPK